MIRTRATITSIIILGIGFSCITFSSCREKSMNGIIICTLVKAKSQNVNYITGDSWRYIPEARIVAFNPEKPGESLDVLTEGYYSAVSPDISFDGRSMLFAGQRRSDDTWQIWEMNLQDMKTRQVTTSMENCTDPAYLPGGRLVFSKINVNDTLKAGHSLYTCNLDGSDLKRITFNPHEYFASTVLRDGRILSISRQIFPAQGKSTLMILRPDGTKAELFYEGTTDTELSGREWETTNGKIIFIESGKGKAKEGSVISINYNRPLHTRVNLTHGIDGDFNTVFPLASGRLLVSCRKSDDNRYSLYEFDPETRLLGKNVYSDADYDILEAVVVGNRTVPKKLPSEVDMGVKSGLLLCQDINVLDPQTAELSSASPKASRIQVLGIDSALGVVNVEKDGSFYLKVIADKPFQIQTLDENGNVLHGPGGWIWLRPNERRGCVGCHEDHEQVPENRVPLAVKNLPVNIPVHISKVIEKKVSLE
jgi:hypothetical protein